jgi:8-oxo-dGTP pyrophosphatase MutT (NUDIX family)
MSVYENAVEVLTRWSPPDPATDSTRRAVLAFLATAPDGVRREHTAGHVTASTLVLDAAAERVLLCLHGKSALWTQLGGHCEDDDVDLAAAALREATEESGIAGLILSAEPIGVDIHPVSCGGGSLHYDVRYAAIAPVGAVEAISAESLDLGWYRPDALPTPLADATECLIAPAIAWARAHRVGPAPGG